MRKRFVVRYLLLIVLVISLCNSYTSVFADVTGTKRWVRGSKSYVAAVTKNDVTTRNVPILDSKVELLKHGRHAFGGCTYKVEFSNTLWSSYVTYLNEAGAGIGVSSKYCDYFYFKDEYDFTATNYRGYYCAMTYGYGDKGSFYVQELSKTPKIVYDGTFTFAPKGCGNVITAVMDASIVLP